MDWPALGDKMKGFKQSSGKKLEKDHRGKLGQTRLRFGVRFPDRTVNVFGAMFPSVGNCHIGRQRTHRFQPRFPQRLDSRKCLEQRCLA